MTKTVRMKILSIVLAAAMLDVWIPANTVSAYAIDFNVISPIPAVAYSGGFENDESLAKEVLASAYSKDNGLIPRKVLPPTSSPDGRLVSQETSPPYSSDDRFMPKEVLPPVNSPDGRFISGKTSLPAYSPDDRLIPGKALTPSDSREDRFFREKSLTPDYFSDDVFVQEEALALTDPPNGEVIPGEVLAPADSLEHAQTIAAMYNLELKSYAYGIAVLEAPNPELTAARSGLMRLAGIPKLSLNLLYSFDETAYAEDITARKGLAAYADMPKKAYEDKDRRSIPGQTLLNERDQRAISGQALLNETERFDEPEEALYPAQWHRAEMDADRARTLSTGDNIIVAVIDTGIDVNHPAFAGRLSDKSYNAHTDQIGLEFVQDDHYSSHGTHVSGIVAAAMDSVADVCGIAPDAEILMIKSNIPESPNELTTASWLRGVNYAVENGAKVINMSFGGHYIFGPNELEQEVIANAVGEGVTVVCSAGNDSYEHAGYPAAYPECIAVSATRQGFRFDNGYSNYGEEIDVAAPGSDIYSTVSGGYYDFLSGTSMASPNVAGAAALVVALHPEYTPQQVRDVLCETARDAGEFGRDDFYGYGIVNAYAAVLGPGALYTVTYDINYGDHAPVTVKVVPGNTLLEPDIFPRDGYVFDGWYLSESDEEFNFSGAISEDITLHARWVKAEPGMYVWEFPDANFRHEVLRLLNDQDGNRRRDSSYVQGDEDLLASLTQLDVSGMGIRDMTGLQYFTGLETLWCAYNQLTELDVSKNTKLSGYRDEYAEDSYYAGLDCSGNQLIALDVSKNTDLEVLSCWGNQITELDVSKNLKLKRLDCDSNQLTLLDLSNNLSLEVLYCGYNLLATGFDVSNNALLTTLYCNYNQLTELDVTHNTLLRFLNCTRNQLTALDLSKNTALERMICWYNQLTMLDVTRNTELIYLDCDDNQLTTLKVSNNTALSTLYCGYNQLTALDISGDTALNAVYCSNNQLTTLNISGNTALDSVYCYNNRLTTLDISGNTALNTVYCYNNQLSTLDVTKNPQLRHLDCESNRLKVLDLSKNTALNTLYCSRNLLSGLDVSNNTELYWLDVTLNYINSVDDVVGWQSIPGLEPDGAYWFYPQCAGPMPTGEDITDDFKDPGFLAAVREITRKPEGPILDYDVAQIDYLNISYWYTPYIISDLSGIEHFRSLINLYCYGQQLEELDLSKNTVLESLSCWNNRLSALNVTQNTALRYLNCESNQLTVLDLSKNTALATLYCYDNQLAALDLSKNTLLEYVSCPNNRLTTLDLTQNTALQNLDCENNQLTALDLSENNALYYLYCTNNQLTALNLSKNTALESLYCWNNRLAVLDVTQNAALRYLDCSINRLSTLDVSNNIELRDLNCSLNLLNKLDITNNTGLYWLYVTYNYMKSADDVLGWQSIPGLALNENFQFYPQLSGPMPTGEDITADFKDPEFLSAVREIIGKPDGPILDYDVSQIRDLYVDDWNTEHIISDLSGIEHFKSLTYLNCAYQQLKELDLSKNILLNSLYCFDNQLTKLDLSKNTALESLYCWNNRLTALDVTQNAVLKYFDCENNLLTELDVSSNTELTWLYVTYNCMKSVDDVIGWQSIPGLILDETFWFYPQLSSIFITVTVGSGGAVSGGGSYKEGDTVTLIAAPDDNFSFDGWYENDQKIEDADETYEFIAVTDRTLEARFTPDTSIPSYTIVAVTTAGSGPNPAGGTVTGGGIYKEGDTVTLIATPNNNFTFDGWYENGARVSDADMTYTFTAVANRTLAARFAPDTTIPSYTITVTTGVGGRVTGGGVFTEGDTVTLTAAPNNNYSFDGWYENGARISGVGLTYTFAASTNRTLEVRFTYNGGGGGGGGGGVGAPVPPVTTTEAAIIIDTNPPLVETPRYEDAAPTDWFFDAVEFVSKEGLMNGTAPGVFSPNVTATRAMLVTILYRLEGSPPMSGSSPFSDIKNGQWYTNAVIWAAENDIIKGYTDAVFGWNDPVTREQAVTILYRYSEFNGQNTNASADLLKYTDLSEISDWALDAIKWAVSNGIVQGRTDTTIVPQGISTRAEIAAILKRYIEDARP